METAEQTEASQIPFFSRFTFVTNLLRTMADVCEAFCFFRVFSGLNFVFIRVNSWFFHIEASLRNDAKVCVIATSPASGVVTYARTFSRHVTS